LSKKRFRVVKLGFEGDVKEGTGIWMVVWMEGREIVVTLISLPFIPNYLRS
jgi:hypothetical protein